MMTGRRFFVAVAQPVALSKWRAEMILGLALLACALIFALTDIGSGVAGASFTAIGAALIAIALDSRRSG